jgi:hypothetical protein
MRLIALEFVRPLGDCVREPETEVFKWFIVSQKIVVMVEGPPTTARSLQ